MKLNQQFKTASIVILLAVAIGFFISEGTIFRFIYVALLIAVLLAITILTLVFDYFKHTRYYRFPGLVAGCIILAAIFGFIRFKSIQYNKQEVAEELIFKLEEIKTDAGAYPKDLSNFDVKNLDEYNYYSDSASQNFVLSFSWDGWHTAEFKSETQEWSIHD